ncbi:S9 family peptidase [Fimbriiglobus ruber]|uniref:Alanyl dipeptidyl peptidase n=1 Tax=Fimbriiglobus ruber TaxID=1908690 RepID=A0A225E6Y2_9BACT|nr:S9 family peptidase [Fimbriiglobus ruber]OWK44425.1 Alanyl dipeptidyl peptidase [Fimbriiglobus ruber]
MKALVLLAVAAAAVAYFAAETEAAEPSKKRPMAIDDLFKFKRIAEPQVSPNGKLVVYQVSTVDLEANKSSTALWLAATDGTAEPKPLTNPNGKSDRHPRWSPDGKKILFESTRSGSQQLWVIALDGGEAAKITEVSTGAGTGLWSPDGTHVAFVSAVYPEFSELPFAESDKKNKEKLEAVEKSPVKARVFTRLFFRHWDSYVEDKRQHLFVCKGDGADVRDVTPGDRDAYPTSSTFSVGDDFTFTPDGKHLIFTAVPMKGEAWSTNHDLCRVSIDSKSTAWEALTSDNKAADTSPRFSPDGKKLAWRVQKTPGYEADKWDIFAVDVKEDGTFSGKPKNLTASRDVSAHEFAWRSDYTVLLVADDGGATSLFLADHVGNVVDIVPPRQGQITGLSGSRDGIVWMYALARMDMPAEVAGIKFQYSNEQGKELLRILRLDGLSPQNHALLAELDRPRPESVEVPVEGGVKMQMWILKPPGFDPSKKWPVAYLIHGGPQGAWGDAWSFRWNPQLWAAQGYVVVLPNPRGSTGFGQKYVDEISGDWGGKCYRDLVAGVEYVEKLPYVDPERIGSAGGSFGGYMQDWFAVSDIAKKFKCLITHCSVWNFESMWGTTEELWFDEFEHGGLPWEVPGKYREFSPHIKAANLAKNKTPMLIIHNDLDFRCPIGQGHELFAALQRQGVPSRFVNFPDEGHWVLKPKNSQFWHKEVFAWLTKYVPPGGK